MSQPAKGVETPPEGDRLESEGWEDTEYGMERGDATPEDASDEPVIVGREAGHPAGHDSFEDASTPSPGEGEVDALFDPTNRQVRASGPGAAGELVTGDTTLPPIAESDPAAGSVIADDWGPLPFDPRPGATVVRPPQEDPADNPLPARSGGGDR